MTYALRIGNASQFNIDSAFCRIRIDIGRSYPKAVNPGTEDLLSIIKSFISLVLQVRKYILVRAGSSYFTIAASNEEGCQSCIIAGNFLIFLAEKVYQVIATISFTC